MKKYLAFLSIFTSLCFFGSIPFFITNETSPKYSAAYIEYLESEDKSLYGDIIPAMYDKQSSTIELASNIPDYYCLRDEYMIFSQDQVGYGLCWAYTSNLSLETFIAINYGEYYNFSAPWVGLTTKAYWDKWDYNEYTLGGGGNLDYFSYAVNDYGYVLQSDFDMSDFYAVDSDNYSSVISNLSSKVIHDLGFEYESCTYKLAPIETIKSHIITNGSLYARVVSADIKASKELCSTTKKEADHAVSIIGWDDNYQGNEWSEKGAWIALNSWGDDWGNDGIFYISYQDVVANYEFYGLRKPENSDVGISVQLTNSSSNVENLLVNKYKSEATPVLSTFDKQLNIFNANNPIELEYSHASNLAVKSINILTSDEAIINNQFNISTKNSKITLENLSGLPSGTYKIEMQFENGDSKTKVIKAFTVFDGLEYGSILYYSDSTSEISSTGQLSNYYANFNSFTKENSTVEIVAKNSATIKLYLPTYSKISSFACTVSTGLSYSYYTTTFTKAIENTYAEGYIHLVATITNPTYSCFSLNISLNNISGDSKLFTFKIYGENSYPESKMTYVTVDYNGATENKLIPKTMAISNKAKQSLISPTKGASTFDGWFTTPNFETGTKLPKDENGYYITPALSLKSMGTNYALNSASSRYTSYPTFTYLNLFAKWIDSYTITYEWTDMDGTSHAESINADAGESDISFETTFNAPNVIGYEFVWSSANPCVDLENNTINNINQDVKISGKYVPVKPIISSLAIGSEQTSSLNTTYTKNSEYKMIVTIDKHEGANVNISYIWKKQNSSGYFIRISGETTNSLTINKASDSGLYICEVYAENQILETKSEASTSNTFNIKINKACPNINIGAIPTDFYYNGQTQVFTGATVDNDTGVLNYYNNAFKNINSEKQTITIVAPETENYLSATKTIAVKLHKAKVVVKLENKRSAVFAEPQPLTYSIKYGSVYEGDDLGISLSSNYNPNLPGTYTISAVATNQNYEVEFLDGSYTICLDALGVVLVVLCIALIIGLGVLIAYFVTKKRMNQKGLDSSNDYFDSIF